MVGTIGHWVMGTLSTSAKRSVEQKCGTKAGEQTERNKNSGIKIGGDHWTLGNGDPKYKCKKVSETKMRNKNCRTTIGGDHWTLGVGDPKYKCKKVSGTKMQNKNSGTKTSE